MKSLWCVVAMLAVGMAGTAWGQAGADPAAGTWFVSGDIEGMSGYQGHSAKDNDLLHAHYLAAVEGLHDGGAAKVILKSFHGVPGDYAAYVEKNFQDWPTDGDLAGLTKGMKGLALVGFHGLPPESGFGHAYRFFYFYINDQKVGEVTIQIMLAATRGVPTVLYVGDSCGAKEVEALSPDTVMVITRPGHRANEGDMDPKVMEQVRAGAKKAAQLSRDGKIAVPKLPEKFVMTIPMRTNDAAALAPKMLKYEVKVEGRRVTRQSDKFQDVYQFLLDMFKVHDEAERQEKAKYGN